MSLQPKPIRALLYKIALASAATTILAASQGAFAKPLIHGAFTQDGCAVLAKQPLKACFDTMGAHFNGTWVSSLTLHLAAFGRNEKLIPVHQRSPEIEGNQITYHYSLLDAWWRIQPMGFEQGFTIYKRLDGNGTLSLVLISSKEAAQRKEALAWGELRYGKLTVTDARDKTLPASLVRRGNRIIIGIEDAGAEYPLTVDPLIWLEQTVTANDVSYGDLFGSAVAVSGKYAIIGAPIATVKSNIEQGAAYIFTESNGKWIQTQKLTASNGGAYNAFGWSVAIDGSTAVVGAPYGDSTQFGGVAYVFHESNGSWTQVAELNNGSAAGSGNFGITVAISGSKVLVGAPSDTVNGNTMQGAVYLFSDSGYGWFQTGKFVAADGRNNDYFGEAIAISGSTAIIGAPGAPSTPGSAYVFNESAGIWSQGAKLTANDKAGELGRAVALSGSTAIVSAPFAITNGNTDQGIAYVFEKTASGWNQTATLTTKNGARYDNFGESVASCGSTVIATKPTQVDLFGDHKQGAAYVYTKSGGTWTRTARLIPRLNAGNDDYAYPVSCSDATTLVGISDLTSGGTGQEAGHFYEDDDLDLAISAPQTTGQGQTYGSQVFVTNNSSTPSQGIRFTFTVSPAAQIVSSSLTQGSCVEVSSGATCDFGAVAGNAGMAAATFQIKPTGKIGDEINQDASLLDTLTPPTTSAATTISSNDSPVASNGTLTVHENSSTTGTLEAVDPDGDPLMFKIVNNPNHGTVTIDNTGTGAYTYTPNHGYSGSDSFTFVANDGQVDSNIAAVSVTVKANSGSSGGGGNLGWLALAVLFGIVSGKACVKARNQ